MTTRFKNQYIWITGGSTGIGAALAIALAQQGANVAISARTEANLQATKAQSGVDSMLCLPMDVTQKASYDQALATLMQTWPRLDLVILNAGTCIYVTKDGFSSEKFEKTYAANLMSVVYGIETCLDHWRDQPGHIAVTGSIAGYDGLPKSAAYGSSKAALQYILNTLHLDYYKSNKHFSLILPGFVKTPLTDKNDFPMPFLMTPEKAAQRIIKGLAKKQKTIVFPTFFANMLRLIQALPKPFSRWLIYHATKDKR